MAREKIGQFNDGMEAFVGAPDPAPTPPVTRYTQPPAPPTVPAVPSSPAPSLQSFDQFSQQRGGMVDENAIREQTRKNMQAQIDSTNAYYDTLVRQENEAGAARNDKVRALNVNSGLGGSSFATAADLTQKDKNQSAVRAVEAERNMQVQTVMGNIDKVAREEIAAKKAEALGNAEAYSTYLEKARTQAQGDLAQLAQSGIDLNTLDPQRRSFLFKAAGYDDQMGELVYNSLKPKASKIDYKAEKAADGKILLYGVDPVTGELKQQRINFDVPEGYEPTYVDGQLYYKNAETGDLIPSPMDESLYTTDYKNYLLSKKEGYSGNFEQWQNTDANRKRSVSTTIINSSTPGSDPTVDAYVLGIRNGTYKPSDVPAAYRNAVANGLAQVTPEMKNSELEKAEKLKASISELKNNPALGGAVGPISSKLYTLKGGTADFEAYFNNIKSLLTLDNLGLMKGVLSDADIKILQQAATPLSLGMSEAGFKKELEKIETTIDAAIKRASTTKTNSGTTDDIDSFLNSF